MKRFANMEELKESLAGVLTISDNEIVVRNGAKLKEELLDQLIYNVVFHEHEPMRQTCHWIIYATAIYMGAIPSSIHKLYIAHGTGSYIGKSVPAIHIRGFTYDSARAVFRALNAIDCGACLFELDHLELFATDQTPMEFASCILAAAVRESFHGPVFLQATRLQIDQEAFAKSATNELQRVRDQIRHALENGFYNIDLDASTLADKANDDRVERERDNFEQIAVLTPYVREIQPKEIQVSIGAEVRAATEQKTQPQELEIFLEGYSAALRKEGTNLIGIDKVAVECGTHLGGKPLPDGRLAKVEVDLKLLEKLNEVTIRKYKLGGVAIHGASNLPEESLRKIPDTQTVEVHLATALQSTVLESKHLPQNLKDEMGAYLKDAHRDKMGDGMTEEQFLRKTRKLCFGPFKKKFWDLDEETKETLRGEMEARLTSIINTLGVAETKTLVREHVKEVHVLPPKPHDI